MSTSDARGPARAPARPSAARAAGLVALIWAVAVAFTLAVASDTRLGPVVYKLTRTHGVHLGDVYATLGCAAVAALLTVWVIVDHRGRTRRYQRYLARRRAAEAGPAPMMDPDEQPTMIVEPAYAGPVDRYDDDEFDYYDADAYEEAHSAHEATQEIPRGRHARLDD